MELDSLNNDDLYHDSDDFVERTVVGEDGVG